MITCKFIILAQSASVEPITQQLSINNIIEEVTAPDVPALLLQASLVSMFERDIKKDPDLLPTIIQISINNKLISQDEFKVNFTKLNRCRIIVNLPFIQINEFGTLKFEFLLKNKIIAFYELGVKKIDVKQKQLPTISIDQLLVQKK